MVHEVETRFFCVCLTSVCENVLLLVSQFAWELVFSGCVYRLFIGLCILRWAILLFLCYKFKIKQNFYMKQNKTKTYNHKFAMCDFSIRVIYEIMWNAEWGSSIVIYDGFGVSWKEKLTIWKSLHYLFIWDK